MRTFYILYAEFYVQNAQFFLHLAPAIPMDNAGQVVHLPLLRYIGSCGSAPFVYSMILLELVGTNFLQSDISN